MAAEISAAIFVGTSSGRSRKTGEELKCADGQAVEFRLSRQEKGIAFRDSLAGLKGGSPHLGAGAKHPCAGQGEGPCPVSDGLPSLGTGYYLPTLP